MMELSDKTLKLFKNLTPNEIQKRAQPIQSQALEIQRYRCIENYKFLYPRISSHPKFSEFNFNNRYILDIGCFFGTDLRYLATLGANEKKLYGIDLVEEFVQLGFDLFGDKENCQMNFFGGNILESMELKTFDETTDIVKFNDLPPFDIVHAGSVLHLLTPQEALKFSELISRALSDDGLFIGRLAFSLDESEQPVGHLRFTPREATFKQTMEEAGFSSIQVYEMEGEAIKRKTDKNYYPPMGFIAKK